MKLKKCLLPLCIIALMMSCFAGCGASSKMAVDEAADEPMVTEAYSTADGVYGMNYDSLKAEAEEEYIDDTLSGSDVSEGETVAVNNDLKLIYTVDLTVETLDYQKSVETIDSLTNEFGGYIEYSQVENDHINSHWLRSANYTLRIPAAKLDAFLESCGEVGNVCNVSKQTENRTTEYVDLSSRLETLKIEEESLRKLLEEAKDLDAVVALHGYLSDVRYEIEQVQTRMRGIDGLVSYSTVNLYLGEVTDVSNVVTPKSSFGERVSARSHNAWIDFCDGMENFGVFMLGELPLFLLKLILVLLPFAIIAFIIIVLIRKGRKRRKAKDALAAQKRKEAPAVPENSENRQE